MRRLFAPLALKLATSDADGARWFKLRHAAVDPGRLFRTVWRKRAVSRSAAKTDRIVVVGTGFAALAFVRKLGSAGYRDITIVTRDDLYGGKCVNSGCMPTEFVLSRAHEAAASRRDDLSSFVGDLRQDVATQFAALGWPIVQGRVSHIAGTTICLDDGRELAFDRLAVAMGSRYATPARSQGVRIISIEDFWALAPGTRVVIDGGGNVAALSLAEAARSLGLHATILLGGNGGLGALPSFRHLLRRVASAGGKVLAATRLVRIGEHGLTIEERGKTVEIACDCLLSIAKPTPVLPPIDGQDVTIYDLDFTRSSWPARPDIAFLGDSAGYFTASEAEAQAKLVARLWETGQPLDLGALRAMPLSFDGPEPLCLVGAPATLLRGDWIELDFRALGWSKVHALQGKLWYLLDRATARVEAIHICHAHAKELVAIARLLIDLPVTDDRWITLALHPSAAEIFLVLADDARRRLLPPPSHDMMADGLAESAFYRLPSIADLSPGAVLPDWLSPEDAVEALLSGDPRRTLAACFARANLARIMGDDGDPAAVVIRYDAGRCEARHAGATVTVED